MARMFPPRLAALVIVVTGLGMVPSGCQRLPVEDPIGPTVEHPDDTGGDDPFAGGTDGEGEGEYDWGCNPVSQTGCSEGEKCTALKSTGSHQNYACVADADTLEPYASCTASLSDGLDGCSAGYVCLQGGGDEGGLCVPLCLNNNDCDAGLCVYHSTDHIRYCADDCSPFDPICATPLQCRRAVDRFACTFAGEIDIGGHGAACAIEDDVGCAAGFVCLQGELVSGCVESHCCTGICDLGGPDLCTGASTCNSLFSAPAPGFEDVGACFVPS